MDRRELLLWRLQRLPETCPSREEETPWLLFPPTLGLLLVLPTNWTQSAAPQQEPWAEGTAVSLLDGEGKEWAQEGQ